MRLHFTALALACVCGQSVWAQGLYKSVDAQGNVVYSDRPPTAAQKVNPIGKNVTLNVEGQQSGLPFELQQVASRYPVTVYTSLDCTPCTQAKNWLQNKGVPFQEKTVQTRDDFAKYSAISADQNFPLIEIGSKRIKGFSDSEWQSYLKVAGYPESSVLPKSYAWPKAQALAPIAPALSTHEPQNATASGTSSKDKKPLVLPPTSISNPAGIRF